MNIAQRSVVQSVPGVHYMMETADMGAFLRPDCAAAILQRQTPPEVHDWLDALDPDALPRGRVIVQPQAVADVVGHLCDIAKTPLGPGRTWLQSDISELAAAFATLMSARYLRLRLDAITTNACRRFHVDAIRARLVCTYRGTGTQYGIADEGGDPTRIFTVQSGAPILLRGSLWPPVPEAGLVHRSPPIEGTGETRLVLVLDAVEDPDDDL